MIGQVFNIYIDLTILAFMMESSWSLLFSNFLHVWYHKRLLSITGSQENILCSFSCMLFEQYLIEVKTAYFI
jgi:hypothetical protein